MKVSSVINQYNIRYNSSSKVKTPSVSANNYEKRYPQYSEYPNNIMFTGLFSRKNNNNVISDDFGMNGNDYTISFKMADIIHRLDNTSILVIGRQNGIWTKGTVKGQLTSEKSIFPHPKDIKNIYLLNYDATEPTIIFKKDKDKFLIYGGSANLTNPSSRTKSNKNDDFWKYDLETTATFGDVIETKGKLKLKFMNLHGESNIPMYDAKYPVESFLSDSRTLQGGLVLNRMVGIEDSNDEIESDSEYGQSIPFRTFDDVAGMGETISFMKKKLLYPIIYPNAFKDDKNHGIILYGPSGTGKTLLALATVGEAKRRKDVDVHLVKINSRDLEKKYVGESEAAWRDVFNDLEENQPAILMIDEIDALMGDRNGYAETTNNSSTSTVAQLLQSIDNLEKTNARVWIIGTTNRPNAIDPAIKRSGRLGDMIEIKRPDEHACKEILDLYIKDKNVSEEFDRDKFAKECYKLEYTGADISQIVSESRNAMYERCGIFEKMDKGTFKDSDLKGLVYTQEDFYSALEKQQINKNIKKKIGFTK